MENLVLEVDYRERTSPIVPLLGAAGARVTFVPLKAGDYRVGRALVIERKSAGDFWRSIFDGRVFRQAIRLVRASPRPLLLVEGHGTSLSDPRVRGAIITLAAVLGVPVLFSRDPADSARWILTAARQFASRKDYAVARPGWRPKGKRARQIFILQGFPGIGPIRASRLLDRFGSIRGVLAADQDSLAEVAGIGPKTAGLFVSLTC